MYAKKVKRKCGVRGCKCIDSFHISLTREIGNSVIICKSCLLKGLATVDNIKPIPDARVHHTEAPPLFFNEVKKPTVVNKVEAPAPVEAVVDGMVEPQTDSSTGADADVPPQEASEFVCPHCGQICKTELGLQKHIAAKHKGTAQ